MRSGDVWLPTSVIPGSYWNPALSDPSSCLRNLGGKRVTCKHTALADIEVNENCCCQCTVHREDFEPETWQQLVQAPVRVINDTFVQGGHPRPFHSPWGRTHLSKGRPSTPALADCVSFHARIEQSEVEQTLRLSGHNFVYTVPKTWSRQPHPDFAIVWLGSNRADALRASLQLPEQRGLARNRDKYGVRIAAGACVQPTAPRAGCTQENGCQ